MIVMSGDQAQGDGPSQSLEAIERQVEMERVLQVLKAMDELARYVLPRHPELWGWYLETLATEVRELDATCSSVRHITTAQTPGKALV
jgi:hypothetical protein